MLVLLTRIKICNENNRIDMISSFSLGSVSEHLGIGTFQVNILSKFARNLPLVSDHDEQHLEDGKMIQHSKFVP